MVELGSDGAAQLRERERERGEVERVSKRDATPSSARSSLMHGASADIRMLSGDRSLWLVSHDDYCPGRFRWVKEPTDRVTSCTYNS